MKILLVIGDHLRHKKFAEVINNKFKLSGLIIEKREDVNPPSNFIKNKTDKKNFVNHFKKRDNLEKKYFKLKKKTKLKIKYI